MNQNQPHSAVAALLGGIEPHAHLLHVPPDGQSLYKMMTVGNLLRSTVGNYLHFNRVDSYGDFPNADPHDGQQLRKDLRGNAATRFEKAPEFSAADYYDQSRARTFTCCFSLENSDYIWKNYANGSPLGKVCVIFCYQRLRAMLNHTLQPGDAALEYNGVRCHQIFSVISGSFEYNDWAAHTANTEHLPNPIQYTYLKDKKRFAEEREFRVSLSALGIGRFVLKDGTTMEFPLSLQLHFDFRAAIADGTIQALLCSRGVQFDILQAELNRARIVVSQGEA